MEVAYDGGFVDRDVRKLTTRLMQENRTTMHFVVGVAISRLRLLDVDHCSSRPNLPQQYSFHLHGLLNLNMITGPDFIEGLDCLALPYCHNDAPLL